jgi:catechol 2,3-dioxygenase-like lactoylglutathione lyase family enzyme
MLTGDEPGGDLAQQLRQIAHVGLTVPKLEPAADWYRRVLGFQPMAPAETVRANVGHAGRLAAAVFGPDFGELRVVHLAAAGGVALELFEFRDPAGAPRDGAFEYWRSGWIHICVVDPEITTLCAVIESTGGRRRTEVMGIFADSPYRMCYCEDPFGNVIEVYTHSHAQTYAERPARDQFRGPEPNA